MNSSIVSKVRISNQKRSGFIRHLITSGVLSAIATVRLLAADPRLSTAGISPKGNLSLSVTGTAGASALVESSPNLADWTAVGSVVLTNGAAGFYLPPNDDFAFLRTRIVDPASLPSAPTIVPKVNQDFVKSRFESGDGQTVKFLDDAGYTYEILLTEDALADSAVLQFAVVNQATGFPAGWNYLTGIQITPFTAALLGDSTLTITAPAGASLGTVAAVAWSTSGREVHMVPRTVNGSQVVIPMSHLGGFGLCKITGTPSGPIAASHPVDSVAWIEQQIALAQFQGTLTQSRHASPLGLGGGSPISPAAETLNAIVSEEMIQRGVIGRLRSALYSDDLLEMGLREYNMITRGLEGELANPVNSDLRQLIQETDALALQALNSSVDRAFARCQAKSVKALVRLYRDIRWTRRGRISQVISLANRERFRDLLSRAARFNLELLSSTAYNIASGSVLTSVSAEFTLSFSVAELGSQHKARISGSSPIAIDTTSWNSPPAGCTAQSGPVPGTGAVYNLSLKSEDFDIDSHVVYGDDDIAVPQIGLEWDPLAASPREQYVLTCLGHEVQQPGGFWAAAFGSLHKSEIQQASDGRQILFVPSIGYDGGRREYRKDYLQSGAVGSGSASETTTLRVTFLGVE